MLLALLLAVAAPPKGQWSVDETGRLSQLALASFDTTAKALDETGLGQLGLAVVASTHGVPPRQFATGVFNAWGVGHAGRNDGVLLFFALDDRKSEIILGDGFPPGTETQTSTIMRVDVVSNMKAGQLDDAVTHAARSLAELVKTTFAEGAQPPPIEEHSPRGWTIELDWALTPDERALFDREGDAVYASGQGLLFVTTYQDADTGWFGERLRRQLGRADVWVLMARMSDGLVVIDAPGAKKVYEDIGRETTRIEQLARRRYDGERRTLVSATLEAMHAIAAMVVNGAPPKPLREVMADHFFSLFGSFALASVLGLVSWRWWLRRRPRGCAQCGHARQKLSEQTDDPHLNPSQRVEEDLGSVDYDVWWCGRCDDALVLRYGAFFSSYGKCDSCGAQTLGSSSKTLVAATYTHGGTVEVTERCRACTYVNTYTRHTAQLTRSSSSSSSRSSFSSSSSSSSSFGGGRSSGGGSSGSW